MYIMTNVTFSVDKDLYKRMKSRPEIKWSEVCRQAIIKYLEENEYPTEWSTEKLRSQLSPKTKEMINSLPIDVATDLAKKSRDADRKRVKNVKAEN